MKSSRVWVLVIAVEFFAICACCAVLGALVTTSVLLSAPTAQLANVVLSPEATRASTPTRSPTATPAPTYTRVVQPPPANFTPGALTVVTRTPTRAPVTYDIFVPTPNAPALNYPISFTSNFKVVTYNVSGQTLNDLSNSLNTQAMPDQNESAGRYYAQTQYYLSARWSTQPTARGCEVENGTVSMAMTMTLPALSSTAGIPPDVLNRWSAFVNNTITHETGHVKLNLQGARDYQRDLGNFPPESDCAAIKPQLSDLFDRASATIRRVNIDYDAETQHGAKQGAVFP